MATGRPEADGRWTFLTNHARVLLEIARDPRVRLRDVAVTARITERAAQAIVADLEAAGYITRTRVGRRNHYTVDPTVRFRHPAEADRATIGDLLAVFAHRETDGPDGSRAPGAPGSRTDGGRTDGGGHRAPDGAAEADGAAGAGEAAAPSGSG